MLLAYNFFYKTTSRLTSESNRYPFKVKFGGEDVYDMKNEIKRELAPRLDLIPACELVLFPPLQLVPDDDLVVAVAEFVVNPK